MRFWFRTAISKPLKLRSVHTQRNAKALRPENGPRCQLCFQWKQYNNKNWLYISLWPGVNCSTDIFNERKPEHILIEQYEQEIARKSLRSHSRKIGVMHILLRSFFGFFLRKSHNKNAYQHCVAPYLLYDMLLLMPLIMFMKY